MWSVWIYPDVWKIWLARDRPVFERQERVRDWLNQVPEKGPGVLDGAPGSKNDEFSARVKDDDIVLVTWVQDHSQYVVIVVDIRNVLGRDPD